MSSQTSSQPEGKADTPTATSEEKFQVADMQMQYPGQWVSMYHIPMRRRKEREKVSEVWKTFFVNPHEPNSVVCRLCGTTLSYVGGSTSGMRNHLQNKHRQKIRSESRASDYHPTVPNVSQLPYHTTGYPSDNALDGQPTHDSPSSCIDSPSHMLQLGLGSRKVTKELAIMCATDMLPLDVVSGKGFRWFLHLLDSGCQLPGEQEVQAAAASLCQTLKVKLKHELLHKPCSLSLELWFGPSEDKHCQTHRQYLTITAHFFTDIWENVARVLGTMQLPSDLSKISAEQLVKDIREVLSEYGVSDSQLVSVLYVPSKLLDECIDILKWPVLKCTIHTFNSCLNKVLNIPDISKISNACYNIVDLLKGSEQLHFQLFKIDIPEDSPSVENCSHHVAPAKWKTCFSFLQKIYDNKNAIVDALPINKQKELAVVGFWEELENIVPVFEQLNTASEALTVEKFQPLSCVLPIIFSLINRYLKVNSSDHLTVKNIKVIIQKELENMFNIRSSELGQSLLALASALDPRHKALLFLTLKQRIKTQETLQEIMKKKLEKYVERSQSPPSGPSSENNNGDRKRKSTLCNGEMTPKKTKMEVLLEGLFGYSMQDASTDGGNDPMAEMVLYFGEPVAPLSQEPTIWWKIHESKYPYLAQLARKFLCIPASSVRREVAFTEGSDILSRLRLAIHPDHVHNLVFLNANLTSSDLEEMGFEVDGNEDDTGTSCDTSELEVPKKEPLYLVNFEKDT